MDISQTIAPKSDQLNADDLIGGPRTVTVAEVRKGSAEQPVEIVLNEYGTGRPFKPGLSMRRVLIAGWGNEAADYVGRRITLYRDESIMFGGQPAPGIRISHMSNLTGPLKVNLTVTRGRRSPFRVDIIPDAAPVDQSKVDAALTAIQNAATLSDLDRIDTYAQQIGIHEQVTDAISERRTRLGETAS